MENNITYRLDENTNSHILDYSNIQIVFDERDGKDIGSEGGIRFRLFYKKSLDPLELVQADEFVVYPDAIDWENGGQMKKEFLKNIENLRKEEEAKKEVKAEAKANQEPQLLLEDSPEEESA